MSLADELKKFIENPDDLSTLPTLIEQVAAFEKAASENETNYQTRIKNLQDANRSYLAQIPMVQEQPKTPEQTLPTFEDAKAHLINVATGGNK